MFTNCNSFRREGAILAPKAIRVATASCLLIVSCVSLASGQGGIAYLSYPDARETTFLRMDVDDAGAVYIAGYTYVANSYDFLNASVLLDGSLNADFGGGMVKTSVGATVYNNDLAYACAVQADGKLLSAGVVYGKVKGWTNLNQDFAITRHNASGMLDSTFNPQKKVYGIVTSDFGDWGERVLDIVLQSDGKILAIGNPGFLLARYSSAGKLDGTFGSAGVVRLTFPNTTSSLGACGAYHHADGMIQGVVVAGTCQEENSEGSATIALARLDNTGNLDFEFGIDGRVLWAPPGAAGVTVQDVAVDVLGGILVVGSLQSAGAPSEMLVARFTPQGEPDVGFGPGGAGYVTVPCESAEAVDIQPDGKIVVVGRTHYSDQQTRPVLARLDDKGSLDTDEFGNGLGWVVLEDVGWINLYDVRSFVSGQLGAILAVGCLRSDDNTSTVGAIMRFRPDGTLDPAFPAGR